MKFLVFVHVSFVTVARDGVFMSKTADHSIVADGVGVLGPMPVNLANQIDDLCFFSIVRMEGFDPLLAYVVFCRGKEVGWSLIDLEDPFFL